MSKSEDTSPSTETAADSGGWWAPKWKIFWIISIISLVADQATKIWARASLPVHPAGCDVPAEAIDRAVKPTLKV